MLTIAIAPVSLPLILLEMKSKFNRIESIPIRLTLARSSVGDRTPERLNQVSVRMVVSTMLNPEDAQTQTQTQEASSGQELVILDDREYKQEAQQIEGSICLVRHTDCQAVFETVLQPYIFDSLARDQDWIIQLTAAIAYPNRNRDGQAMPIMQTEQSTFRLLSSHPGEARLWHLLDATF